ncbi:fructosamine kinase family protein [Corynebacterium flavescens]|uniref:Fructosamine kinase n=1 Tax=Corynebacterium flavescens TaxID=28028 RepID=A0A1L7CNT8_CORFL|nr:fructosamine kinase family protein [Corynebacterium flavescens]APT87516.1 fructosamine kinase [Corynebacterium flavescens]KAA8720329.1 phosphotransferase [Corynebacterium flavescens]MDN6099682.1 fructosamine kinase family protein [Corynebacterium flavescens]MDN6198548.1 fructosamine kinase family protein [Corynebacterium flavescens]MDN6226311.1 fructosamine kinase family protein [Corynebacterium flavescens]
METFRKRVQESDQAGAEAAGLRWLAQACPETVVRVVSYGADFVETQQVREVRPTPKAAFEFGVNLRRIHDAGAPAFGSPPQGWEGKNYIGRVSQECTPSDDWGQFYAEQRVLPFAEGAGLRPEQLDSVKRACAAIEEASWDIAPARLHGDLWAGNLLFSVAGGIVIDPAAHGGHPHTDLGMLALFGAPYLEEIFRGYGAPRDIERWIPLHQLHPLAVHSLTHGAAYHRPLQRAAALTLELLTA